MPILIRILQTAARIAGTAGLTALINAAIRSLEKYFESSDGQGISSIAQSMKSAMLVGVILRHDGLEGVRAYQQLGILTDEEFILAYGIMKSAHVAPLPLAVFENLEAVAASTRGASALSTDNISNDSTKLLRLSGWLQSNLRANNISI